jgi:hypothetical protein
MGNMLVKGITPRGVRRLPKKTTRTVLKHPEPEQKSEPQLEQKSEPQLEQKSEPQLEQKSKHEKPIWLLDFDDTLSNTTGLKEGGENSIFALDNRGYEIPEQTREVLRNVDIASARLLTKALESGGTVYIVTNGEDGWVQTCCVRFFPLILKAIRKGILVWSARAMFSKKYPLGVVPGALITWKEEMFRQLLTTNACDTSGRDVISIGDSDVERIAILKLQSEFPKCVMKSIKLREKPTASELQLSLKQLCDCLPAIIGHDDALDLTLSEVVTRFMVDTG